MPVAPTLLISEIEMRWNNAKIGNYEILPLKRQGKLLIGEKEYIYDESPYSRLLILWGSKEAKVDYPLRLNVGQALSSLMSFVMRCSVISFNERFPAFRLEIDRPSGMEDLSGPAFSWAENWEDMLGLKPGSEVKSLRRYLHGLIPSPAEEQNLLKTIRQVYEILMKIDEEVYYSIIGAMRLYQLALNSAKVDFSLTYSLLVAVVDAVSSGLKAKVKLRDIDPEGKLMKLMEQLQFDKQLQEAVKNLIVYHESLTERFSNFIAENLPNTFWEGDYSMSRELDLFADSIGKHHWSGQHLRDIADGVPEPQRQELLRRAEEDKKRYEEFLKERPERKKHRWVIDDDRRKWMMSYLRTHLGRVLRNTFESRSELFHRGRGFPKIGLKEESTDWIPDVFEEDFREFMGEHLEHRWNYSLDEKGRIFRSCSCGDRKEVKVLLGIHVFERMVHDSILSYLLKMNNT